MLSHPQGVHEGAERSCAIQQELFDGLFEERTPGTIPYRYDGSMRNCECIHGQVHGGILCGRFFPASNAIVG